MTEPTVRSRRGAHRERRSTLAVAVPLVGALVAAAVVVGGAAALGQADGQVVAQRTAEPVEVDPATPSADVAAQDQPATVEPVEEASEEPTSEAPAGSPPAAEERASDGAEPSSDVLSDDAQAEAFQVAVLNQGGRSGLAATVAERIEGEGWSVSGTGNFTGTVSATTVYFPPGGEEAAEALAADLPVPGRTRPTFGNLQQDKLTIVVTADYP